MQSMQIITAYDVIATDYKCLMLKFFFALMCHLSITHVYRTVKSPCMWIQTVVSWLLETYITWLDKYF